MNNEEKNIVPQLRFPAFENSKEWKKKPFSKLFKIGSGRDYKHLDKGEIPVYGTGGYMLSVNDYLYDGKSACIGRKGTINKPIFLTGKFWTVDTLFYTHSFKGCSPEFIYLLFQNINWLNYNEAGGVPSLSKVIIYKIEVYVPKPEEQEKIIKVITSLDNIITAETKKLDLLKDHKKGLLQQLFPTEGETQPKLRFPEFKNDGNWIETTLDEVADYENGKAHEQEISDIGKYKVVNSKFISTEGQVVKFTDSANLMANTGDILMVLSDIPNGKAIAKCFYVDKEDTYTVNQRICKITPTDIDIKFLFYVQNRNKYFLAFDDGVKQTNLRKDTVLSFPFLKPKDPKEQEKIANCLTLADNLIKEQANKIEQLQDHKKGLLQQLFPTINELTT